MPRKIKSLMFGAKNNIADPYTTNKERQYHRDHRMKRRHMGPTNRYGNLMVYKEKLRKLKDKESNEEIEKCRK